jgi:putative SOS response-associated peptidase YedK
MCGRFTLCANIEEVIEHFALTRNVVLKPRYNIAPSQVIPVIRIPGQLEFLTWGLKPKWLKEDQNPFINARMETLGEKPAFRNAFKNQRCIIVADGYYEWKLVGKVKQPFYISLKPKRLFAFAGLWDADSCTIITKPATNSDLSGLHERMPVILKPADYAQWLNAKTTPAQLQNCMLEQPGSLQLFPVSTKINNPKFDFAACTQPLQ